MAIRWDNRALLDIADINDFYTERLGEAEATRIIAAIYEDIRELAITPLTGQKVKDQTYQLWYAMGRNYQIYYRRIGPRTIRVYRVWPSRREPLKPEDIMPN